MDSRIACSLVTVMNTKSSNICVYAREVSGMEHVAEQANDNDDDKQQQSNIGIHIQRKTLVMHKNMHAIEIQAKERKKTPKIVHRKVTK